jgi:hypothetical protein
MFMMSTRGFFTILIFVFSFCQWHYCGNVFGEEKLAVINKFKGDVIIQHEGENQLVEQRGARIRNSSIYNQDSISTMEASTAELVFNDSSRFDINEKTTLTIISEKTTKFNRSLLRRVSLKAGGLLAEVIPSKTVLTEFEIPTGVATVRGTVITINLGVDLLCVVDGEIIFTDIYGNEQTVITGECISIGAGEVGYSGGGSAEQPTDRPASPFVPRDNIDK